MDLLELERYSVESGTIADSSVPLINAHVADSLGSTFRRDLYWFDDISPDEEKLLGLTLQLQEDVRWLGLPPVEVFLKAALEGEVSDEAAESYCNWDSLKDVEKSLDTLKTAQRCIFELVLIATRRLKEERKKANQLISEIDQEAGE